jgi:hypothetical protein
MRKNRILLISSAAILIGLAAVARPARADVFMKQKVHTGAMKVMGQSQPEKDTIRVTWLGPNKVRMDQDGGTSTVFLADKKVLYLIDHNKKQYSEMPLDFEKMMGQAAEAQAGEDPDRAKAMEKMPAAMKNMMKGMMEGMSATVTDTGETKTIGSWTCRKYLVEMNMGMMGKVKSESWATEDLKVDTSLYFTSANAMMASQPGFEKIAQEMRKIKGVVVSTASAMTVMGSDVTSTTELLECADKAAPAGTYELPAGYTKVKGIKG